MKKQELRQVKDGKSSGAAATTKGKDLIGETNSKTNETRQNGVKLGRYFPKRVLAPLPFREIWVKYNIHNVYTISAMDQCFKVRLNL